MIIYHFTTSTQRGKIFLVIRWEVEMEVEVHVDYQEKKVIQEILEKAVLTMYLMDA